MFKIVLRLNQLHMRRNLILHVVHIAGTSMIKEGIDGILRGNNRGRTMRGLNPLQFVSLYKVVAERSTGVE